MFSNERELLSRLDLRFDFHKYKMFAIKRDYICKDAGVISETITKLFELAEKHKQELKGPRIFDVRAFHVTTELGSAIAKWELAYTDLLASKEKKPDVFRQDNLESRFNALTKYYNEFCQFDKECELFNKAVDFITKFEKFAKTDTLSEDKLKEKYEFVENQTSKSDYLGFKDKYIPKDVANEITVTIDTYNTVSTVREYYDRVDAFCEYWQKTCQRPFTPSQKIGELNNTSVAVREATANINDMIEEFSNFEGDRNLKIFSEFEKTHRRALEETLVLLKEAREIISAVYKQRNKNKKVRAIACYSSFAVFMAMLATIVITTMVKTVISYWDGVGPFWAIVFGIIVGALYSALRVVVLLGMGSVWWPESVNTLILPEATSEISSLLVVLNAALVVIGILYILIDMWYSSKYGGGFILQYGEVASIVATLVVLCVVVRILWSAIAGLVEIWSIWPPIEVICGLGFGIFRLIMSIFGAGFWWPGLYGCTGDAGAIINASLYIVIAVAIVFVVLIMKLEEKVYER